MLPSGGLKMQSLRSGTTGRNGFCSYCWAFPLPDAASRTSESLRLNYSSATLHWRHSLFCARVISSTRGSTHSPKGGLLGPFAWVLLASLAYGIFEVIRGILLGFTPLVATE